MRFVMGRDVEGARVRWLVGVALALGIAPAVADAGWNATASLANARAGYGRAVLDDGRVLVCGGTANTIILSSCEIYNPTSASWATVRSMTNARTGFGMAKLVDGRVLAAGGRLTGGSGASAVAEIYNPATNVWTPAASMLDARSGFGMAVLDGGRVLAVGGDTGSIILSTAEIYTPATNSWSFTDVMNTARTAFGLTRLRDGRVLVAGGSFGGTSAISSAEVYDPGSGTWSDTQPMADAARGFSLLALHGFTSATRVLRIGGQSAFGGPLNTCEIWNSATGAWTPTGLLHDERSGPAAAMLPGGNILVAGGLGDNVPLATAEEYVVSSGTWTPRSNMSMARTSFGLTRLASGKLLAAAGAIGGTVYSSAELYTQEQFYTDVPPTHPFYRFITGLGYLGVTSACNANNYCPDAPTTREEMARLLLRSKEGPTYLPPACTTPMFTDVPCSSPYARWVNELARRGITGGCGGGNFCPTSSVTREQMAVFLLVTKEGTGYVPPACTEPPSFTDVPCSSPYSRWIYELVRRGITGGCSPTMYCPTQPISRGQMAVFLTTTFGLP